jgi:hypothetical protein
MADEMCTFSFISAKDCAPKRAIGIERSWFDLKLEFHRVQDIIKQLVNKDHSYSLLNKIKLWYYYENKLHCYRTATDVKHAKIHSMELNPQEHKYMKREFFNK